jgi:hypothetical protein
MKSVNNFAAQQNDVLLMTRFAILYSCEFVNNRRKLQPEKEKSKHMRKQ